MGRGVQPRGRDRELQAPGQYRRCLPGEHGSRARLPLGPGRVRRATIFPSAAVRRCHGRGRRGRATRGRRQRHGRRVRRAARCLTDFRDAMPDPAGRAGAVGCQPHRVRRAARLRWMGGGLPVRWVSKSPLRLSPRPWREMSSRSGPSMCDREGSVWQRSGAVPLRRRGSLCAGLGGPSAARHHAPLIPWPAQGIARTRTGSRARCLSARRRHQLQVDDHAGAAPSESGTRRVEEPALPAMGDSAQPPDLPGEARGGRGRHAEHRHQQHAPARARDRRSATPACRAKGIQTRPSSRVEDAGRTTHATDRGGRRRRWPRRRSKPKIRTLPCTSDRRPAPGQRWIRSSSN
jgi:hypothetical protein